MCYKLKEIGIVKASGKIGYIVVNNGEVDCLIDRRGTQLLMEQVHIEDLVYSCSVIDVLKKNTSTIKYIDNDSNIELYKYANNNNCVPIINTSIKEIKRIAKDFMIKL